MSELGRLLREARTAKIASLADVEAVTRIRQRYLEAFESGDFSRLPRGTVARGFIRTYAAYLGLDADAMLQRYSAESGDAGDDVTLPEPGKARLADYRPLEVGLSEEQPRAAWWPWLAAAVIVIALGAAGWWFLSRNPGWNPLQAFGPAPTATNTATITPTPTRWVVTATPLPTDTPGAALPTPTSNLLTLPTPTVPASPTPTPRPTATPVVVTEISLELRTTQRVWLRVTVDGGTPEEGMLGADESRTWEAKKSIVVRTGNAGGVVISLNGEDLGPMGEVGQVVERAWIVAEGEITETASEPASPTAPPATLTPTPSG